MNIRTMLSEDLPEVFRIQGECFSADLAESNDSIITKLRESPEFCFVAVKDSEVMGYTLALPMRTGEILPLNDTEYTIPADADSLYLHDMAVSPSARKLGVAPALLKELFEVTKDSGFAKTYLIAVSGASTYWTRHGFEAVVVDDEMQKILSKYGDDAVYMVKGNLVADEH